MELSKLAKYFVLFLADKSNLVDFSNSENLVACIPLDIMDRINFMMTAANGWDQAVAPIINLREYLSDSVSWEIKFGTELNAFISEKCYVVDFANCCCRVSIPKEEINQIKSLDLASFNALSFFTNLVKNDDKSQDLFGRETYLRRIL